MERNAAEQRRVGDGDGAGGQTTCSARRGEQMCDHWAVYSLTAGVDVCAGGHADAVPGDCVGERVVVESEKFEGLPALRSGRRLVAAFQAGDKDGRGVDGVGGQGDPRPLCTAGVR